MEEDKKIDELFRDGLESHQMEPPDRVWEALDARLSERKRRRGGWLMLGALLLLSGVAWYFSGPSSTGNAGNTVQPATDQVDATGADATSLPSPLSMTSGSSGQANFQKHGDAGAQNTPQASTATTQQQQSSSRMLRMPGASATSAPAGQSSLPSSSTTAPVSGSTAKGPETPSSGTSPGNNTQRGGDSPAGDGNVNAGGSPDIAEVNMNVMPPDGGLDAPVPPADAIVVVSLSESKQSTTTNNPEATPTTDSTQPAYPVEMRLLQPISRILLLDIYFAPELSNRTLQDNPAYSGAGSMNSIEQFKQNSSSGFSWSAGVRLRYNLGRHFSVGTGLAYSQYTQTTQLADVYVLSDSAYRDDIGGGSAEASSHYVVHTACGPISLQGVPPIRNHNYCESPPRNGDTLMVNAGTDVVVESFHVPLTLRYKWQAGKINWYAESGAAVNILSNSEATVRIGDAYQETNSLVGLKRTTFSFLMSVGMEYTVNNSFGLFIEPGLRYYLTPINENSPVLSYPNFIGIKGGVSLRF